MIKKLKLTTLFLSLVMFLMTLTSCAAPTAKDLAGAYKGSYEYMGYSYTVTIVFTENYTYAKHTSKNGNTPTMELGEYRIDGNEIICTEYPNGNFSPISTVYKYTKNTVTNNNHKFKKIY